MMRYDKGCSLKSFKISWYLPWHSDTGGRRNLLKNHRLNHFSWDSFHLCALWMHDLSIFCSLTSHSTQSKKTFSSVRTLTLFFSFLCLASLQFILLDDASKKNTSERQFWGFFTPSLATMSFMIWKSLYDIKELLKAHLQ